MADDDVRWALVTDDQQYELPLGVRLVAGRAPDAPVQLDLADNLASRYHAAFEASIDCVLVIDLDSRYGVFINDRRFVTKSVGDGDLVRLGSATFRVRREIAADAFPLQPKARPVVRHVAEAVVRTVKAIPYVCEICEGSGPVPAVDHEAWWIELAWICPSCAEARRTAAVSWEVPRVPQLGEFDILRFVARGGMGAVYEARHVRGGMRAAVKVMLPERALDRIALKRFLKEQKIVSQLAHPRVVRSIDVGTSDRGEPFVATEFLSQGDADGLASSTSDVRAVVSVAADMFAALAFAHENGFVHRDVKPTNLLVEPGERGRRRAKLSDFGLAKSFRDIGGTVLTKEGEVGGSASFIAPEQLLGFRDVGPTADVYSASSSLYYLLTGDLPLVLSCPTQLATQTQICLAALSEPRVPILSRRPNLHPYLAQWIDLLVTRDHTKRAHVAAATVAETLNVALQQM